MFRFKKILIILVLMMWFAAMIQVARGYEELTLQELPVFNASIEQNRIELFVLGGKYSFMPAEYQEDARVFLNSCQGIMNNVYSKIENIFKVVM